MNQLSGKLCGSLFLFLFLFHSTAKKEQQNISINDAPRMNELNQIFLLPFLEFIRKIFCYWEVFFIEGFFLCFERREKGKKFCEDKKVFKLKLFLRISLLDLGLYLILRKSVKILILLIVFKCVYYLQNFIN